MHSLTLQYPVQTLEGKLLLPAGSTVDEDAIRALIAAGGPDRSMKTYILMDHGSISHDLTAFLAAPPYDVIFSGGDAISEIMDVMKSVRFVSPVLEVLDFFKGHDMATYRHMLIIFALTILIARDLIPGYRRRVSEIAHGPTHDFGKIAVPLEILKKEQPLTNAELKHLKHHTLAGYVLLGYYFKDVRSIAAKVARDHHERLNGSGYPSGIRQADLMVEIVAVCDIYDALISERPYRPLSYDNRTALEALTEMAEKGEIGWRVVKSLIAHNRRSKPSYHEVVASLEKRGTPPANNLYGRLSDNLSAGDQKEEGS